MYFQTIKSTYFMLGAFLLLGLLFLLHPAEAAEVIFVNGAATGNDDGTSWADAYTDLQPALGRAASGDEVWVAAGVYLPGNVRSDAFFIPNNVSVYGGFDGTEVSRERRDWLENPTVLSGDIDNNDTKDSDGITTSYLNISGDNSYHVVRIQDIADTAHLDGFIVSGGLANGAFPDNQAGGLFNESSTPTIENMIFIGNSAFQGGAIYNDSDADATFRNVTFEANFAPDGGAVYNWSSKPVFTIVEFSDNVSTAQDASTGDGAAVYSFGSELTFTDATFNSNSAENAGGALFNDSTTITINSSNFANNSAARGGAIGNFNESGGDVTDTTFSGNMGQDGAGVYSVGGTTNFTASTFSANVASGSGGGIFFNGESDGLMQGSIISGNNAAKGAGVYTFNSSPTIATTKIVSNTSPSGAGVYNEGGGSPTFVSVLISGNESTNQAGGMGNENADPILINVTITGNYARVSTGGIFNNNAQVQLKNSIIADNVDDEGNGTGLSAMINNLNGSTTTVSNSLIENSGGSSDWETSAGVDGGNNIDVDPQFISPIDPLNAPTSDGDFRLDTGSSGIDTGDNSAYTSPIGTDVGGKTRVQNSTIDMGAHEFTPITLSVLIGGTGTGSISGSGLNCSSDCSADFAEGASVTLSATPDAGVTFIGWGGACSGTGSCILTMDEAKSVTATFDTVAAGQNLLQVSKSGTGNGLVVSSPAGINCGTNCSEQYDEGEVVTLTASALSGSVFAGWTGPCSGTDDCQVTMSTAQNIGAEFNSISTDPEIDTFIHLPIIRRD